MKKLLSITFLLLTMSVLAQSKKLEATNKTNGNQVVFQEGQRVKVITSDRKKIVGMLSFVDLQTINVNGTAIKTENLSSIKYFPKGGRTIKNILLGTGAGLLATSGILAADNNGSAFAVFGAGTGTIIIGALVNNKNKTLVHRHYVFKVVE
ncbi:MULTISPECIES: hypothetical protein [unclassified Flavobacterium]|uniref:hypothetical protein n=1 Tax=unclassified Flavobacterium TaxID=196869 RepID=UPI003613C862